MAKKYTTRAAMGTAKAQRPTTLAGRMISTTCGSRPSELSGAHNLSASPLS